MDLSPSEQLSYTTVRIECDTAEGRGTGTGFFFAFCQDGSKNVPAIVTNKHVIAGAIKGRFHIHLASPNGQRPIAHESFEFDRFEERWILHPDPNVDLCIMPIGPLLTESINRNKRLFYIHVDSGLLPTPTDLSELMAMEELIMIGYPNGIWDDVHNAPVFRRGITATHPAVDYRGNQEFMIDAACFPGSSGSPVFLYNFGNYVDRRGTMIIGNTRIKLLGVLYAGPQYTAKGDIVIQDVPTAAKPIALSRIPNNLGIVIKSSRLLAFEPILNDLVKGPNVSPS